MNLIKKIESYNNPSTLAGGFFLIAVIGLVDYLTGNELDFSLFYLFPIALVTWNFSRQVGIAAASLSAATWLLAEVSAGEAYSNPLIYGWNTIIRFGVFIIVASLLSALQASHERQKEPAHSGPFTGATESLQPASVSPSLPNPESQVHATRTSPIRILLIDDSRYFTESLRDFLNIQNSIEVMDTALDGVEGLSKSLKLNPDVILLDLNLGDLSGLELIPLLRAQLPHARIIILTIMHEEAYRTASIRAGADAFVTKLTMNKTLMPAILNQMELPARQ